MLNIFLIVFYYSYFVQWFILNYSLKQTLPIKCWSTCLWPQSSKAVPSWGQDLASELLAGGLEIEEGPLHFIPHTGAPGALTDDSEEEKDDEEAVFLWVTLQRQLLRIAWSVN